MIKDIFKGLDYEKYCIENSIHKLKNIDVDLSSYGSLKKKTNKKWETVEKITHSTPASPPELDDLIRLHYLIRLKKSRTVLEIGPGKSTSIILDALEKNKKEYKKIVKTNLRCSNLFELHSIDNNKNWLENVSEPFLKNKLFHPKLCDLNMGTFNDRICTYYEGLPNIRPDFIYLDGPDQFSASGDIRGLHTRHSDRMPMSADLLALEYFFEPGLIVLVDGRTSNARFLKNNFQRDWDYYHFESYDQHIFRLDEEPLGIWNKNALDFEKI